MRAGGQLTIAPASPAAGPAGDGDASVYVEIGGIDLHFHPAAGIRLKAPGGPYRPFLRPRACASRPSITAHVSACSSGLSPAGGLRFDADGAWRLWGDGARRWLAWHGRADQAIWLAETDESYLRYRVKAAPILQSHRDDGVLIERLVSYPLDQMMFIHGAPSAERLLVHAGGVSTRGRRGGVCRPVGSR